MAGGEEGARGQEYNAWGTPPNPPSHVPTLAFTRMLSGPMDFTPGIFDMSFNGLIISMLRRGVGLGRLVVP